ncbi:MULTISPECIES: hypothetical protein [Niastella]|uniref:Barstar (barnase inhibitor) domain-containing protein n=1 Tax=Niastella soli TaxID=2821487 RepID=A0ABS3YRK9_9BACT|nr:hypothetical protein [Niastella soli]MBO9200217.1 hypothetical protein [Niastella soli]
MLADLNEDQRALHDLMSQISEAGYCAGWLIDLEFDLWTALHSGKREYGRHIITQGEIHQLQSLADKCGCWIVMDDVHEETAVDLKTWKAIYSNRSI